MLEINRSTTLFLSLFQSDRLKGDKNAKMIILGHFWLLGQKTSFWPYRSEKLFFWPQKKRSLLLLAKESIPLTKIKIGGI